eukprot:1160036-Pelagomonas_calceolata.AAC.2
MRTSKGAGSVYAFMGSSDPYKPSGSGLMRTWFFCFLFLLLLQPASTPCTLQTQFFGCCQVVLFKTFGTIQTLGCGVLAFILFSCIEFVCTRGIALNLEAKVQFGLST